MMVVVIVAIATWGGFKTPAKPDPPAEKVQAKKEEPGMVLPWIWAGFVWYCRYSKQSKTMNRSGFSREFMA